MAHRTHREGPGRFECWAGWLHLDGWSGHIKQPVIVVGETPKRFRIEAVGQTRLAGRGKWMAKGERALVPRFSVTRRIR